jgi:hypothetical protein
MLLGQIGNGTSNGQSLRISKRRTSIYCLLSLKESKLLSTFRISNISFTNPIFGLV